MERSLVSARWSWRAWPCMTTPPNCMVGNTERTQTAMKSSTLKQVAAVVLSCGFLALSIERPERKVEGNTILSERDPQVVLRLPKPAQYLGADRWELYGVADCELHVFVEADAEKNVQRLYWVQFEGYLPTKPDMKHAYDSPKHTKIGGLDFYVDTWVRPKDAETRSGSD